MGPLGHTQKHILTAALTRFASRGYAGTSVQDIVDAARVTKPALYYYYPSKAGLYQALVDSAHDERYRLMQEAAQRESRFDRQLVAIMVALFEYTREHRELMRLAFATAFVAPDEMPKELHYARKCERNFEFMHSLIKQGLADGDLDPGFDSKELAFGIHGLMNVYLMAHLLMPECKLDRPTAERVVQLFLAGAEAKGSSNRSATCARKKRAALRT